MNALRIILASLRTIFLPKIVKICENLMKFWQNNFAQFFWDTVYIAVLLNHFFGNNTGKFGNYNYRLDEILQEYVGLCDKLPYKVLAPSTKWTQNEGKNRIVRTFLSPNNASFYPLPGGRFPWNLNTKRQSMSLFFKSRSEKCCR